MKKIIFYLIFIPFILTNIYGCWFLVGGAVGVAGFYAVSKDTIQGETQKPYDSLWDSALNISKSRGIIKQDDYPSGYIQFDSGPARVYIRLIRLTETTNRLRVAARKYKLPNLTLAQDIFVKIIEGAEVTK